MAFLCASDGATWAETITGAFRYADFNPVTGGTQLRPIQFCKVEVHSFRPRIGPIWTWAKDLDTTTDGNGRINVSLPFQTRGVVYAVRVFAQNYGVAVWPNQFAATGPFSEEPGKPDGAAFNPTVSSSADVVDFSYDFQDSFTPQHWNIADAVRRGWDYVAARRDPSESDPLPAANVQPGFAFTTFYNPVNNTLEIQNQFVFDDITLLHEFGHFVEHQISHFAAIPTSHDGCVARDLFGSIVNSPEHAWMEGFADFFAQAVVANNPTGTFQGPAAGTFSVGQLENTPWDCPDVPAGTSPMAVENVVAGILWDLFDATGGCGTPESHDELQGFDTAILQIVDRELDGPNAPTLVDFQNAWINRGFPVLPWVNILRHYGLASPPPAPSLICPADLTVAASGNSCSATVTYPSPALDQPRRCASILCVPGSGSTFALGSTTVNCRAIENGQVLATCAFNVNVQPSPSLPNPHGSGLLGVYYDNPDFTQPKLARVEPVDFDWGLGSPGPGLAPDTFAVRWSGKIVPRYTGDYRIFTVSDDGIRVWIDGFLLMDAWNDHPPTEYYGDYPLQAGREHEIVIEMYENGGGAVAKLLWQSACQPKEIVPASQLLPAPIECPTPGRPSFNANFIYGRPAGVSVFGSAVVNGGWLKLTTPTTAYGIAYIDNFSGSQPVWGFEARFKAALFGSLCCGNGALPADGFSFNLVPAATVLPNPDYGQPGEEGLDQGLAVNFDTWDNGFGEGPAIEVKWLGQVIARQPFQASQSPAGINTPTAAARDTRIVLDSDGRLTVDYGGVRIFNLVQTPYTPQVIGTPKWIFGARTGGANDNHWIRDLSIVVNRANIPGLFSTGVDALRQPLPDNAGDPHYENPGVISTLPWVARGSGGFPIPPWLADNGGSAWISVTDNTYAAPDINMEYTTSFDLRGLDPLTAAIHGWVAADNELVDVRLNGVSTGVRTAPEAVLTGEAFATWQALAITGGFRPGVNTLSFIVRNGSGGDNPSGLRAQLYGWGTPPPLMKLGLGYSLRAGAFVSWGSLPHKRYYLESAPSAAGPWSPIPANGVDSGGYLTQVNQFFLPGQRPPMSFFRVLEAP